MTTWSWLAGKAVTQTKPAKPSCGANRDAFPVESLLKSSSQSSESRPAGSRSQTGFQDTFENGRSRGSAVDAVLVADGERLH